MSINFNQVTKVEIPKYPYQQVEYLNFNGTDNYMYSKLLFGDVAIITEFEFSLSNINSGCLVGVEALQSYLRIYADRGRLYVKSKTYFTDLYYETMCTLTKDVKYKLRIENNSTTVYLTLTQNETTLFSDSFHYVYTGEKQHGQDKAYLMARNLGGDSLGTADQFATGKIYSFKQWGSSSGYPNNTQFVPILNTSTGDVGLVCNYSSYIETPYLMNGTITSSSVGNAVVPTIQFPKVEVTKIQRGSTILWRKKRLVSIALTNPTTSLPIDSDFSFGGTVTATYSDSTTADVTSSTTFSGYDMSTAGTYTVTASYGEFGVTASATYQLTITPSTLYELYEGYYLTSHSYSYNTNYIDLGIKWNNNWKLECKFYKPTTTTQWGRLMGTGYDTSTEVYVNYNAQTNGNFVVNYGNTYVSELNNVYQTNVEYNFAFGNRGTECRCYFLKPGGSWASFGNAWTPSNRNSTHNFRLFSNEQGDRDGIFGISKVQINGPTDLWSEEGALMLLVPARRKSDNKLGMYDKNNDVFYPVVTSGSGYFTITDVSGNIIYQ